MGGFIFVLIVVVLVGMVVAEKVMAATNTYADSRRSPEAVRQQVQSMFNSRLNRFDLIGPQLLITPKLRKDPPTLHIEVTPQGAGAHVHMWAEVTSEKRGVLPWIPRHGLYVWRKQRSIAKTIEAVG